ncbi:MAG: hypothetical protein PWQ67_2012 [Clostridia bacterium]|jgi:hypothetical protein|nr:hypothetical protein [Clostridia bacterium]
MSLFAEVDVKAGERQIEELIKQLKGIVSCSVVALEGGKIQEIHIIAESNRSPKQIVRDVESALMAELGIEIDHKKISVAQNKQVQDVKARYKRLKINDVETKGSNFWVKAKVSFSLGEKVFEGNAEGPNSGLNRHKLLAIAALQAIENMLEQKVRLVVEDFSWQNFAGQEVATIILSCVFDNKIERLVGACLAESDRDLATIKAVLDALNRRLEIL